MTKQSVNECPEARSDGLLTEHVGDELVIFDAETNEAHALKPLAAAVFAAADGHASIAELATSTSASLGREVQISDVETALSELSSVGLLCDSESADGVSRRRLLQVGGAVAAGALVTSALVPAYAAASTTCQISGLSQFGILIFDGTNYFFVVGALAGKGPGAVVTGGCSTDFGGNSGGNGSNGVCWHGLTTLDGHALTACTSYTESISFTVSSSGTELIYTLPTGTSLVAWWGHNGSLCAGPNPPSTGIPVTGGTQYTTNPGTVLC